MKSYVLTTGVIFALITVAHILRLFAEPYLTTDPFFIALTVLAAALSIWAGWLIGVPRRGKPKVG